MVQSSDRKTPPRINKSQKNGADTGRYPRTAIRPQAGLLISVDRCATVRQGEESLPSSLYRINITDAAPFVKDYFIIVPFTKKVGDEVSAILTRKRISPA